MKINKLFHWLYFAVMMLPIFILPIFALAVRSDNNYQPIEIQTVENKVVNFNQIALFDNESGFTKDFSEITVTTNVDVYPRLSMNNLINGNTYYIYPYAVDGTFTSWGMFYNLNGTISTVTTLEQDNYSSFIFDDSKGYIFLRFQSTVGSKIYINLFDVSRMFDYEDLPSIGLFRSYFPNNTYDYTFNTSSIVPNYTVVYNDTDFASQMVYTMYQGVDKYFNYDNVFNFGDLYTWLNITFFSGNAPLGFFIFWHLLIYWLLTSILWLIFDVLMYVPQLVHRWLDKASLS